MHSNTGDTVKDNIKLIQTIYKDADMSVKTLDVLLKELEAKQNNITKTIKEIRKGYETFKKITEDILEECKLPKCESNILTTMFATKNVKKEVKCDNSDKAISRMVIQGINIGIDTMRRLLEHELNEEYDKLGHKFLSFQLECIDKLKEYE